MKGNHSAALRALYIILVPVVLLIILLNSGWLQRLLPAATVHGETYSVVRYNFYYFDYYNSFLEQYEDQLDELGYDPEQTDSEQIRDDGLSWKEFFPARGGSKSGRNRLLLRPGSGRRLYLLRGGAGPGGGAAGKK